MEIKVLMLLRWIKSDETFAKEMEYKLGPVRCVSFLFPARPALKFSTCFLS